MKPLYKSILAGVLFIVFVAAFLVLIAEDVSWVARVTCLFVVALITYAVNVLFPEEDSPK